MSTLLPEASLVFRLAFDENSVAMALLDADGRLLSVNPALARLIGHEIEELEGRTLDEITHEEDRDSDLNEREELISGERYGSRVEKRLIAADGSVRWVAITASAIHGDDETPFIVVQVDDIGERRRAHEELRHQAMHDSLTGLPNRAMFMEKVAEASAGANRGADSAAVVYLDLDDFKTVNDVFGHAAGDELLVALSRRVREVLRDEDVLARLGGDEFAVLCRLDESDSASEIAKRISKALQPPFTIQGQEVAQHASVGVAVRDDETDSGSEALIGAADAAMFRAKTAGKGRFSVIDPADEGQQSAKRSLGEDLSRALDAGELTLHYQPQLDLLKDEIVGYEALLRWQHPDRGLVQPRHFLPVVDSKDVLMRVDAWVLATACAQAAHWSRESGGDDAPTVSINLSAPSLAAPGLAEIVTAALAQADLAPELLCVEIDERLLLDRRSPAVGVVPELRETGVRLSIDSFGVGISSLSALKHLPPLDELKIDASLTARLGSSPSETAAVAAMIGLAHGLSLTATAEGVERPEQLAELRGLDCDRLQGFYICSPLPADQARALALERVDRLV